MNVEHKLSRAYLPSTPLNVERNLKLTQKIPTPHLVLVTLEDNRDLKPPVHLIAADI